MGKIWKKFQKMIKNIDGKTIPERMPENTRENNARRQARKGEGIPEEIPENAKEYRGKMVKKGKGWAKL